MKNYEVVIIDDDQQSLNKLGMMVLSVEKDCTIYKFNSLSTYSGSKIRPDVLFLDIDLNEEHGFDLYAMDNIDFPVVVISGSAEYAVTGYEYDIFDFLIKPFSLARVKIVMDKLALYKKSDQQKDKLLVSLADSYKIVDISGIVKLEAEGKYTRLVFDNDAFVLSSNNLGYFELLLNQKGFFRVHNSCIINMNKIEKIIKGLQLQVVLTNKSKEPISKRQKAAFINKFNKA